MDFRTKVELPASLPPVSGRLLRLFRFPRGRGGTAQLIWGRMRRPVSGSLWKAVGKPCSAQPGQGPEGTHGPQRAPMPGGRPVGDPAPQRMGGGECFLPVGRPGAAGGRRPGGGRPIGSIQPGALHPLRATRPREAPVGHPGGTARPMGQRLQNHGPAGGGRPGPGAGPGHRPHSGRRAPAPLLHHRRVLRAYWGTASPSTWPMGWRKIRSARRS